jgi:hypothetical protein
MMIFQHGGSLITRRESHHTGMSFTGCTGGAQMRNYSKSILNASLPEVVFPLKPFSGLILMNNLFIPPVPEQGCSLTLLALSIIMRGSKNVNKRLFRPIETIFI